MQLTTGNTLNGKAGTASAITYTITGDRKTTTDSYEVLGQGQLGTSTAAMLTTSPVAASTQLLISKIQLANTTALNVTGIVFYLNGTAATNQIATLAIPANGTAVYTQEGYKVYDSNGAQQFTGATGPSSTIAVGSVTNVGSAGPPTVVNAGTPTAAVFNFGLQQGATGSTGAPGVVQTVSNVDGTLVPDTGNTATDVRIKRAALTGDVTAAVGSNATVYNNVVPAAKGGAGTVSGILKANGSGTVSQAVSATDYAPATTGSSILKASSGGFTNAVASTDYIGATTGSAIQKASSGGLTAALAADVPTVAAGGTGALSATDGSVTNSRTPSGSAGGGLTGTYPNPTVATNANLTGDVTSVGNATTIAPGVIIDADVNASAAIAGSKLQASAAANSGTMSAANFTTMDNYRKAYVNILDYGGDRTNATSSATALTNAIAAVNALGGGTVFFPAGVYNFGNTPYTHSTAFVNIVGSSRYGTYLTTTSTTTGVFIISGNYISLEDFTVNGPDTAGNVQNTSATAGTLIDATGAFVMLRRMTVRTGFNAVRLGGILDSIDDIEIRYYKGTGITVDHNSDHQIKMAIMDNNVSWLPTGAGIKVTQAASLLLSNLNVIHANFCLDVAPAGGVTIPSIKAVNCFFDTSVVGLNMQTAGAFYRSVFTNCWFSSMSTAGIRLNPTTADGVDGINFVNCDIYNNVAGTTTGVDTNTNVGRWKLMASQVAGWTVGVNLVAGTNHYPSIIGNSIGALAAFAVNGTGLVIGAGTYNGLQISNNDCADNTVDATIGALTITATAAIAKRFRIIDNTFNPRGAVTAPIATPVTATTYVNNTGFRCAVTFGGATITAMSINGVSHGAGLANQKHTFTLEPGSTIAITGTTLTAWFWSGM